MTSAFVVDIAPEVPPAAALTRMAVLATRLGCPIEGQCGGVTITAHPRDWRTRATALRRPQLPTSRGA